jgi:hypothetical protein
MSKAKFLILFLAVAGISLTSCKKEDPAPTKTELLAKTWKISEFYEDGQLISDPSLASVRLTFNANGTYTSVGFGSNSTGSWEFNADDTRILMDKGTVDEFTGSVVTLSTTTFKMTWTEDSTAYEIVMVPA